MQEFLWNYFKQTGDIHAYMYLLELSNCFNNKDKLKDDTLREISDDYTDRD
ncbi:YqzL-like protein [Alkalithermobacter thermoalcaliphilus JW-YL-7 = DSM 7308]|uniref:YqzL-like protein n=1 Tax=Alkalithermobacter thermoalcaliphilus JW-YL-7 = DSM 7308 TaxID=1121328 RepID=A0A150FRM6_CLOPD|nr:YqzL-like protein [[Clostridium] paradoxum JW-YL-7 = DSM 7308]SHK64579.1 YqzL-like protein [[Clostridium] paradoxum JW-YL-7 = DSM 7308]